MYLEERKERVDESRESGEVKLEVINEREGSKSSKNQTKVIPEDKKNTRKRKGKKHRERKVKNRWKNRMMSVKIKKERGSKLNTRYFRKSRKPNKVKAPKLLSK